AVDDGDNVRVGVRVEDGLAGGHVVADDRVCGRVGQAGGGVERLEVVDGQGGVGEAGVVAVLDDGDGLTGPVEPGAAGAEEPVDRVGRADLARQVAVGFPVAGLAAGRRPRVLAARPAAVDRPADRQVGGGSGQ